MPIWTPRLLVDESLPAIQIAQIFPTCDILQCQTETKDPAVIVTAREENAVILCSDRDFFGNVSRQWMHGRAHALGPFRACRVSGKWSEAEPILQRWSEAMLAVIETTAPADDDSVLIKLGPWTMYVIAPRRQPAKIAIDP